jgi:hypothetical protein
LKKQREKSWREEERFVFALLSNNENGSNLLRGAGSRDIGKLVGGAQSGEVNTVVGAANAHFDSKISILYQDLEGVPALEECVISQRFQFKKYYVVCL